MNRILFAMLFLPALASGQDAASSAATPRAPVTQAPVCHCQAQCSAMWAQATKDVENASGMRLRIATDALLETYVSNSASRQTGTVTKTPASDGSYQIEMALEPWVRGQKDVQGVIAQNIAHFNQRQNAIAEATTCP